MAWGVAIGLCALVVVAVVAVAMWFQVCWDVSDGKFWGLLLFLFPLAAALWGGFYLEALEGA